MLWGAGLGVVCGAGNCEHLAYEIRRVISTDYERPPDAVDVYLVSGGSAMLHMGPTKMPYFLKVTVDGEDVTPNMTRMPLSKRPLSLDSFVEKVAFPFSRLPQPRRSRTPSPLLTTSGRL